MKKFTASIVLLLFIQLSLFAQKLAGFTASMSSSGKAYLSISQQKAYTKDQAAAVKNNLDLVLLSTKEDNKEVLEWYNLERKHEKAPAELSGTKTAVVAISFDRDQFDQCKTAADLKRMTGHLTAHSFSHFAVLKNGNGNWQRCFITQQENGKRALIYVTGTTSSDELKVEVKSE